MVMQFLLNISTHAADLEIIDYDWRRAQKLLEKEGFDGYELYPVGHHSWENIPAGSILGLHLWYYPILAPLWRMDCRRLREIFGDPETVKDFYGGYDREDLIDGYRRQLALAESLGCRYVVFHLGHAELEYIYHWQFPWNFGDTLDLCAEILHAVFAQTEYRDDLLLENLWWPGSFRGDTSEEIAQVLESIDHPRTGIMLDTGHLLNTNQALQTEDEGIGWLEERLRALGDWKRAIRGVHLTKSLSSEYVMKTRRESPISQDHHPFWSRYHCALEHVRRVDQHEPFCQPGVARLFELIDPIFVTYEFIYRSLDDWLSKIHCQRKTMARIHGSRSMEPTKEWKSEAVL